MVDKAIALRYYVFVAFATVLPVVVGGCSSWKGGDASEMFESTVPANSDDHQFLFPDKPAKKEK